MLTEMMLLTGITGRFNPGKSGLYIRLTVNNICPIEGMKFILSIVSCHNIEEDGKDGG